MSLATLQKVGISIDDLKSMLTNAWDKTTEIASNDYVKYPLIGAGVGALGMGGAAALGGHGDPENPEKPGDKVRRISGSALRGAAFGGMGGLGYAALKGPASRIFEGDSSNNKKDDDRTEDPLNKYVRGAGATAGAGIGAVTNTKNYTADLKDRAETVKGQAERAQQAFDAAATGTKSTVGLDTATAPAALAGMLRNPNFKIPGTGPSNQPAIPGQLPNNALGSDAWIESQLRSGNLGQAEGNKGLFDRLTSALGKNDRVDANAPTTSELARDAAKIYHSDVGSTYADKLKNLQPTIGGKAWAGAKGAGAGAGIGWLGTELGGRIINSLVGTKDGYNQARNDLK